MFKRNNSQHEYEFLPAVLEVQDSPPSPIGRMITWLVVALTVIAIVWASLGQVDIVATAQGKIITAGNSKIIQPLEIGVVKQIHVQEGQSVKKGDPLVELDTTDSSADKERLESQLRAAQLEIARQTAITQIDFQEGKADKGQLVMKENSGISQDELALQTQLLQSEVAEYSSKISTLNNQEQAKKAEKASTRNIVTKLEKTLPIVTERAESLKKLADRNLSPKHTYLEMETQRISQEQDLKAQRNRLDEIESNIKAITNEKEALQATIKKTAYQRIAELNQTAATLEKELQKINNRKSLQLLTSPVDGVVNQVSINTIGGVVTPAQALMTIVSKDNALQVEAWVANKDIGFVEKGQQVEVKVEAFPFTKYGVIDAEILNLSYDAIPDEKQGLIYKAKVQMNKSAINVGEKLIELVPGMNVTVEVKTGKRYLIEYILSPVMEYQAESIRER